ncbi:MAG TPA: hypothetical protein VFM18_02925 [Methanosarcina sp.]|nr:hypothetical protein [Methanosarcina sp.]
MTTKTDWKIGDKFRVTDEDFKIGYPNVYEATKFTKANDGVYCIVDDNVTVIFGFDEIEKIEDKPVEKILVVNKSNPEFSVYVEKTEEAIKKFFFGTRLQDFYVIDSGKLIELETSKDIKKLFQVSDHFDTILTMEVENTIMIDNHEFTLCGGTYEYYLYDKTNSTIHGEYVRKIGHTKAWYTLQEFSDMLKNKTYYIA